ncbi:MAG: patatin-like phospholipase family protein [Syntrophales bacterium]
MKTLRACVYLLILLMVMASCTPVAVETIRPPVTPVKPAKIALVLGAGASRGFAHIGVLKILEANRIPIHMIMGTSAGSFVGSLYAYGLNAFQLQKIALTIEKADIVDLMIPDNGFIKGEKLEDFVNKIVQNTPIEKFRIPFYAVSTAIPSGEETIFAQGNTGKAVRASCSIPGVFRPPKFADKMYVDGGVVSPVAVDAAKRFGADFIIAVDISADLDTKPPVGTIDTILQSINITYAKLAAAQISRADVVIKPKVGYIGSAGFEKRNEAIMEGEKAALAVLPTIQNLLARLRQEGRL